MLLKIPIVVEHPRALCELTGFGKSAGEVIAAGDVLGELSVKLALDDFFDSPVHYRGDLVARAEGELTEVRWPNGKTLREGDVVAVVGDEPGDFPVEFVSA